MTYRSYQREQDAQTMSWARENAESDPMARRLLGPQQNLMTEEENQRYREWISKRFRSDGDGD